MRENLSASFAKVLRKNREAKNMSQQLLADRAGVSLKMIGTIERHGRNPTINLAKSIAGVLKMPLWKMIKEAEELP